MAAPPRRVPCPLPRACPAWRFTWRCSLATPPLPRHDSPFSRRYRGSLLSFLLPPAPAPPLPPFIFQKLPGVPHDLLHISYFVPQLLYRASVDFGERAEERREEREGWQPRGRGVVPARILIFLSAPLAGYIQNRLGPHLLFVSLTSKMVQAATAAKARPEKNRSAVEENRRDV